MADNRVPPYPDLIKPLDPGVAQSTSDRLRPPYPPVFPGANPLTPQASRLTELGYRNLPAEYQDLLNNIRQRTTSIGEITPQTADRYGWLGFTLPDTGQIAVSDPTNTTHELVHEMFARMGSPYKQRVEEALARLVANRYTPDYTFNESDTQARNLNAYIQDIYNRRNSWLARMLPFSWFKPDYEETLRR